MSTLGLYVPLSIYAFTLAIELLSVYLVNRQRATAYPIVRSSLLGVYIVSILILFLELIRLFLPSQSLSNSLSVSYMKTYAAIGITLVLLAGLLLAVSAVAIYLRPKEESFRKFIEDLLKEKRVGVIFLAYLGVVVLTAFVIDFFQPYLIQLSNNMFGDKILTVVYKPVATLLFAGVLVFFMAYAVPLFFFAARRITNRDVRRNLTILPVCYVGVALDLLIIEGYLTARGVTANAIVYLVWGALFGVTAVVFSNAATVSSFFDVSVRAGAVTIGAKNPFSERLGRGITIEKLGNSILLEVDPSLKYEDVIFDFSSELIRNGYVVFTFTSKGSPAYSALSSLANLRFYLLSGNVSYVKSTMDPLRMLVPATDVAVLLDAYQRTSELVHTTDTKIGLIYDNVSGLIADSDFENTYKFLRRQNEAVTDPRVTKLFLLIKGAQDAKYVNLIRSLFPVQLFYDSRGLRREK